MKEEFSDIFRQMTEGILSQVNTMLPAQVESYDPKTKKVSVKPLLKKSLSGQEVTLPVINNVPVVFPSSKKSIMSFPLEKGDGIANFLLKEEPSNVCTYYTLGKQGCTNCKYKLKCILIKGEK